MLAEYVKYKPLQAGARTVQTYTYRAQPTSGATAYPLDGSSTVTFSIPAMRNSVILWGQSRMKCRGNYSITSAGGNISARVDHSVYSAFKRVTVSVDQLGVLENINEVGKLFTMYKDASCDSSQQGAYDQILEGCEFGNTYGSGLEMLPTTNTSGSTFTPKQSYQCMIPCGLAMANDAFPSFAMPGNIEIAITLATANEHLYATAGSTINTPTTTANYFDNFELLLQVVQYSDEAIAVIRAAAGHELFYSFKSFDSNSYLASSGSNSINVTSTKRSVLALLGGFWVTTKTDSATRLTGVRSIAGGVTELWLNTSAGDYPRQHLTGTLTTTSATAGLVRNNAEFAAELLNVVNQFNNTFRPGALDGDIWSPVVGSADVTAFMFGIDLETQPSASLGSAAVWTGLDMSQLGTANLNVTVGASRQLYTWYISHRTIRIDQATGGMMLLQ